MFEVIDSISCRMWLETSTLLPERPQSRISWIVRRRMSGIHAAQRLVEDQHLGIVRDGLRHLDALTHPLAVGADLLVRRVHQIDRFERAPRGRRGRIGLEAVQA